MRRVALILLALALACGFFALWGVLTEEGAKRFEEVDGLIQFFALRGSGVPDRLGGNVAPAAGEVMQRERAGAVLGRVSSC